MEDRSGFMNRSTEFVSLLGVAKVIGTATGVAGAIVVAGNLGFMAQGFMLFFISSVLWSVVGWVQREISLLVLQATFSLINIIGIYRWLGT